MANEYVGNIIPAPGFWKGNESGDPELLASYARFTQRGVTLAPGQGVVEIGQPLAQRTSDKMWVKYSSAGGDGANVCRGFNRRGVDTGTSGDEHPLQANIVISGILKLHLLKMGSSASAITSELNGRVDDVFNTFTF